jgi:hypothetical protein
MNDLFLFALAEFALVSGAILGAVDIFPEGYRSLLEHVVVPRDGIVGNHDGT